MNARRPPLHVLDSGGSGPAFLFVHGFGTSSRLWDDVVAGLPSGVRYVRPDLRGFGSSLGKVDSVSDHVDDLQTLTQDLGFAEFVLVGHSMGGKIAAAFAARRPFGLQSLILIASSPLSPEPMDDAVRASLLDAHGDASAAAALTDQITARPLPEIGKAGFILDMVRTSPAAWRWWLERGSREDLSADAEKVAAEVTLLAGACDASLGVAAQSLLAHALRTNLLTVVLGAGHLLPLEEPEACVRALVGGVRNGLADPANCMANHPKLRRRANRDDSG